MQRRGGGLWEWWLEINLEDGVVEILILWSVVVL
jgi:hypothetical protein